MNRVIMDRGRSIRIAVLLAAVVQPVVASAAAPCPPPQVSVVGGTSATTKCPATSTSTYSTTFSATENPVSEGGKWINGKAVGLDWNNVQTASGNAVAAAFVSGYNDPIAVLNTDFSPDQFAQGTVHRQSGYSPSGSHEVELLLRFRVTAHSARGYEILWGHSGELNIVRWNGPVGDYTPLGATYGPDIGPAVDGDVLRAEIIGSVIKVYKNGVLVMTGPSNSTWTDGQPGVGFFPRDGASLQSYGWKDFTAGSL